MSVQIIAGDCLEVMPTMDAASVDSIVTDPPYGLKFMGRDWDHGIPGEHFWREALRVAKPGAHLLAFGGDRTHHRLMVAIEDAGWEMRTCIYWLFGSGFPKSLDVSKAIDKAAGAIRQQVGVRSVAYPDSDCWGVPNRNSTGDAPNQRHDFGMKGINEGGVKPVFAPATDAAKQWQGWGTALKPAAEIIIVARKPFKGGVAANVLKHGTGAINVAACRIDGQYETRQRDNNGGGSMFGLGAGGGDFVPASGRWPANVCHDGSDEVVALFPETTSGDLTGQPRTENNIYGSASATLGTPRFHQGDSGSAARFFYCAKASRYDRNDGTEKNHHPTVKPTELMRWLCRLVTPPGGTVLDPFAGSGSTLKAAELEGFSAIGIELDGAHVEIARKRIASDVPLFAELFVA